MFDTAFKIIDSMKNDHTEWEPDFCSNSMRCCALTNKKTGFRLSTVNGAFFLNFEGGHPANIGIIERHILWHLAAWKLTRFYKKIERAKRRAESNSKLKEL